jgi:hypothetical protein
MRLLKTGNSSLFNVLNKRERHASLLIGANSVFVNTSTVLVIAEIIIAEQHA